MTIAVKASAISILFCAILIATYPAIAIEGTSSGTRKDVVKERVDTRKENVKTRIETRKENVQERISTLKERMASREAALKERLLQFKDKKKAEVTERVSTNLNKINKNHTQMMLKFLNRASEILTKLETRVNQRSADIKDPTAANSAISEAKTAIMSATEAVNAQAEKDYTIVVSSESRVKVDTQAQRKKLHDDLAATREIVGDAKKAVSDAIRIAKGGPSASSGSREATPSGQ